MKIKKKLTAVLCSLMAALLLLPVQALAAGSIDIGREVQLTISYEQHPQPRRGNYPARTCIRMIA